jgi:hypothetical protein
MVRITVSKIVDVGSSPAIREKTRGRLMVWHWFLMPQDMGSSPIPWKGFVIISLSLIGKALFFEIKDTGSSPVGIRGAVVQH